MLIDSRLFNILLCTKAGDENFKRTFARVRHYYAVSPLFLFRPPKRKAFFLLFRVLKKARGVKG